MAALKLSVPVECCNGIKAINSIAVTITDRHYACECLKDLAKSLSGINAALAASLPGKCGVNVTYSISTSNNCAQYV
ncbi:hypothetical protein Q3G72_007035 [Acer saccharum]|nr:hypothetical protein Q3G72_007035 [Acer saccharum]